MLPRSRAAQEQFPPLPLLCSPFIIPRALLILFLAGAPLVAQSPGKVVEDELPPAKKRGDPLVFAVYLPTGYDSKKPAPLILAIHAGRGTARQFTGFLRPLAEAQHAVLVSPQGFREVIGADGYWWKGDKAEMAALTRLLEHMKKKYSVDEKRVTLVGLADGAELGFRWAFSKGRRGLQGIIALNFLWKMKSVRAPKGSKVCLIASRDAKEKAASLKAEAEKASKALTRAKCASVLRVVPGSSRSFFSGWEKEFRFAYEWFNGKRDWPKELAEAAAPEKKR